MAYLFPPKNRGSLRHINGRQFITAERYKLIPFKLIHFRWRRDEPPRIDSSKASRCLFARRGSSQVFVFLFFGTFCFIFSISSNKQAGPPQRLLFMTAERFAVNEGIAPSFHCAFPDVMRGRECLEIPKLIFPPEAFEGPCR